ncbi:MAG: FAD-dependent oxidoreductase [Pseudomonadota bacterium]|nr:FAD-dependent oxidoreductase [Pseudomonadota bacterium]
MRHVIIGAGPAGVAASDTLRKLDPDCQITLIGDEPEPPYSRMAIPYYLVDQIDEHGTYLRKTPDHFESRAIDRLQDRVTRVQADKKSVLMASGAELAYDKLLIATGSKPIVPPIRGIESQGVHACWTLEDARNIIRLASPGARVVLIGAGFIGSIILEALARRGTDLSVVEVEDRMVPRMMNQVSGNLIRHWCEKKGLQILTSTRVETIEPGTGNRNLSVQLDNGNTLAAELVISATGVHPHIDYLDSSGIEVDVGVLVNNQLQSSDADIYAAGDVAQGLDFSTGGYSVQAIQPTAVEHGRLAAGNMAGHTQTHRGSINMNVLDTMGLISSSFGLWMGVDDGDSTELHDAERFRYLNLQFQDDRLIGASSLGLTEHIGIIRGLIQTRLPLKDWKPRLMKDPTRLMEAYLANTQAIGYNAQVL